MNLISLLLFIRLRLLNLNTNKTLLLLSRWWRAIANFLNNRVGIFTSHFLLLLLGIPRDSNVLKLFGEVTVLRFLFE